MILKIKFWVAVMLFITSIATNVFAQRSAEILYVYDGDSFTALISGIKTDIRLINVDCPEVKNKYTGKEAQPFGDIAKGIVKTLIYKKKLKVKLYGNDQYGRTLAEVWVNDGGNKRALSNILIKNGLGWVNEPYISDIKLKRILLSKQKYAQRNKIGLWSDSLAINPSEWRKK